MEKAGQKAKMISKVGSSNGLSLELYVGLAGVQDMFINRGIYLEIHNSSKTPLVRYEGLKIPVNIFFKHVVRLDTHFYLRF